VDANLTWNGYFEDLPALGSLAIYNPSEETPDPDRPAFWGHDQLHCRS
jgi:hypothetical protein